MPIETAHDAIESLPWDRWKGRIIHNPSLTDVPPCIVPWRNQTWKRTYAQHALDLPPIYLREVTEHQGGLTVFGVTPRAETVTVRVVNFRPFVYVKNVIGIQSADDAAKLAQVWNMTYFNQNRASINRTEENLNVAHATPPSSEGESRFKKKPTTEPEPVSESKLYASAWDHFQDDQQRLECGTLTANEIDITGEQRYLPCREQTREQYTQKRKRDDEEEEDLTKPSSSSVADDMKMPFRAKPVSSVRAASAATSAAAANQPSNGVTPMEHDHNPVAASNASDHTDMVNEAEDSSNSPYRRIFHHRICRDPIVSMRVESRLPAIGFCAEQEESFIRIDFQHVEAYQQFKSWYKRKLGMPDLANKMVTGWEMYHCDRSFTLSEMFMMERGLSYFQWVQLDSRYVMHEPVDSWNRMGATPWSAHAGGGSSNSGVSDFISSDEHAVYSRPFAWTSSMIQCRATSDAFSPIQDTTLPPDVTATFDIETVSKREWLEQQKVARGLKRDAVTYHGNANNKFDHVTTISTELRLYGSRATVVSKEGKPGYRPEAISECLPKTKDLPLPLLRIVHQLKRIDPELDNPKNADHERDKSEFSNMLVYTFDNEDDMLFHYVYLFRQYYDIGTFEGFNSIGFDMPYVVRRLNLLNVRNRGWMSQFVEDRSLLRVQCKKSTSLQQGKFKMMYVDLKGMTQYDSMVAARRFELPPLPQYKLDTCCKKFLELASKDDFGYDEIGPAFYGDAGYPRARLARYASIDVVRTRQCDLIRNWNSLARQICQLSTTSMWELMMKGQYILTWHQIQMKLHSDKWVMDEVYRQKLQFILGYEPKQTLEYLVGTGKYTRQELVQLKEDYQPKHYQANPYNVLKYQEEQAAVHESKPIPIPTSSSDECMEQAPLKPKPMSMFALMRHDDRVNKGLHSFRKKRETFEKRLAAALADSASYTGGHVENAVKGFHQTPVAILDFASLYPSAIMAWNICFSTFMLNVPGTREPDWSMIKLPPGVTRDDVELGVNHDGRFTVYFVKKFRGKYARSICPEIERHLVATRRVVKKAAEDEKNPVIKSSLSMREKALKVLCNGLYGAMKLLLISICVATCGYGRNAIQGVIRRVRTHWKMDVLYGDTDSLFVAILWKFIDEAKQYHGAQLDREWPKDWDFLNKQKHTYDQMTEQEKRWVHMWRFMVDLEHDLNEHVPEIVRPMQLDFELLFEAFLSLGKKFYSGIEIVKGSAGKLGKPKIRGFPNNRRDYCELVRTTLDKMVKDFLASGPNYDYKIVLKHLQKMANDMVNMQQKEAEYDRRLKQLDTELRKHPKGSIPYQTIEAQIKTIEEEQQKMDEVLIITVQAKDKREYKPASMCLRQVRLIQRMREERQQDIPPGSRVPYVMTLQPDKAENDRAEDLDYCRKHRIKLDRAWYLDKQIRTISEKLLMWCDKNVEADRILDTAISKIRGFRTMNFGVSGNSNPSSSLHSNDGRHGFARVV